MRIGTRGLAQGLGIAGDVEHVVVDLKRQADGGGVAVERCHPRVALGHRHQRPQTHPGADQRAGLVLVHRLQRGEIERRTHRSEIDRLPRRHAVTPGGLGQGGDERGEARVLAGGEHLEGQSLQRIAGEDRQRLVEGAVHRRTAAAQVVVVHRRQVIVDQRVGVDHLQRGGGGVERLALRPQRWPAR